MQICLFMARRSYREELVRRRGGGGGGGGGDGGGGCGREGLQKQLRPLNPRVDRPTFTMAA